MTRPLATLIGAGVLVTLSVGCAKPRPSIVAPASDAPARAAVVEAPPRPAPAPAAGAVTLSDEERFAMKTLAELNAERPLGDAFFDYDQSTLREDGRAAIARNAEWLRRWPSVAVTIEGHSDERGTAEYNIALAERRANTVREYLVSLGIPAARLEAVSLGREQPFCRDTGEACWQQNRRGHFVITAK